MNNMATKKETPRATKEVVKKKIKKYNQKTDSVPFEARPYSRGHASPYEGFS